MNNYSDFDVCYLAPKEISTIRSRNDVDLHSSFYDLYPLIGSPMAGISSPNLIIEMGKNNCLGILHRFKSYAERLLDIDIVYNKNIKFGIAIGINNFEEELFIAKYGVEHGAILICVDIANGYLPQVLEIGKILNKVFDKNKIAFMTGNIINKLGAEYILNSGYNFVRCSIGSGNVCTTRLQTGIGRNALAVLKDCSSVDINLVIDGGIRNPGDVVKSFAHGGNFAMLGSVLAYSNESENIDGKIYGMASRINHEKNNKEIKSIEGRDIQIDISEKKPLKEILNQFLWGIKSACTYLNCSSYNQIQYKSIVVPVNEIF